MNSVIKNQIVNSWRNGNTTIKDLSMAYGFSEDSIHRAIFPKKEQKISSAIVSVTKRNGSVVSTFHRIKSIEEAKPASPTTVDVKQMLSEAISKLQEIMKTIP